MSLLDTAERFASMDRSSVTLDKTRCLHSRDHFSSCEACYSVCPTGAIISGKPPVLDSKKCESCLACLTVCSVGAYSADDAVSPLLNSVTHFEGKALELVCETNPNFKNGISESSIGIQVRGCLAGLGTGAYLALTALGLERVAARTDGCAACKWAALRPEVEAQVARAKSFLTVWDKAETLTCVSSLDKTVERPLWNASNPPLSRRDLFHMLAYQGQVAVARAMEYGQTHSGPRPGRDHMRMVSAVGHLPAPDGGKNLSLGDFGFASLKINETCTACEACARGCPTGALQFAKDEEQTTYTLKFSARSCVACELCVHVCAPEAATLELSPTFADVFSEQTVVIQAGELVKCERCGSLTAKREGRRLCDLCEYRSTHPFGSILPPGFKRNKPVVAEGSDDR